MKRKGLAGLLPVLVLSLLLCGYSSLDPKVFDEAGLLTESEENELQEDIVDLAEKLSLDIVVVTTEDTGGKSTASYAEDFYDSHGFGYEREGGSGVLFLIDMDNRQYYVDTIAAAQEVYTDSEQESTLDDVADDMREGDYYSACRQFLRSVEKYATNSEVALNGYYDEAADAFIEYTPEQIRENERAAELREVFSAGEILKRLGISLVIGIAGVGLMILNVRGRRIPAGRVYLKPGSERIRARRDFRTNTTVTTRHIPKNNGSGGGSGKGGGGRGHTTSHRSRGGHSHSGSGRSF